MTLLGHFWDRQKMANSEIVFNLGFSTVINGKSKKSTVQPSVVLKLTPCYTKSDTL